MEAAIAIVVAQQKARDPVTNPGSQSKKDPLVVCPRGQGQPSSQDRATCTSMKGFTVIKLL